MICRRAAPGPAAPGTPRRAAARAPGRPRRTRQGPAVRPGNAPRAAPAAPLGETPGPRKSGPRWPGNAAVAAAREHSAVCAARAPGRPPPPEAQLAPARAARRAPGSVPRRPRAARKPAPAPQPGWPREGAPLARPAGVYPQGGSNPWSRRAGDRGPLSRRKSHNQTGD